MDDDGFGLFMKFALLIVGAIAAVFFALYAIPLFALWVLIKGWDNTGVVVKTVAFIIPVFGLIMLVTQNGGAGLSQLETIWLIAAPILNYGMIGIAYARRDPLLRA